ncbi:leech-derived tryptase inhibitor C-like [Drosophila obscura]|uniref:leech-derived tryptase inhibitor C-like n=1 Tax=Drosophila obscura TaxID=7282 RepID=UPI001BB28C3B|nr:leech-derived tryptase inhibitor C-like [Drosophila obscura]
MRFFAWIALCLFAVLSLTVAQKKGCFCPANWEPVCGSDGRTYSNKCSLECRSLILIKEGKC